MVEHFGDNIKKSEHTELGSLSDFGISLVDSALARPYNATIGTIAPKIDLSKDYNHNSYAAKIGDFGGTAVDIVIISKFAGAGVSKALGAGAESGLISTSLAENRLFASTLSLSTTGALYGGVFTPGSFQDRLKNATVDAATFGVMGAASTQLGRAGFLGSPGSRTFMQEMGLGALSGAPGGIVNAEMTSLVNGRGLTFDAGTLGKSALYYGAFGAAMGGIGHGVAKGSEMTRSWWSNPTEAGARTVPTEGVDSARPAEAVDSAGGAKSSPAKFNIPETGNVELGSMMRDLSPADQIRLVQEVVKSRPSVPVGSWMRLIGAEEMPNFLRATDQLFPDTALGTANFLIESRNMRPPTPDSPPVDFAGWQKAIEMVKAEKLEAARPATEVAAKSVNPSKPVDVGQIVESTRHVYDSGNTAGLAAFSVTQSRKTNDFDTAVQPLNRTSADAIRREIQPEGQPIRSTPTAEREATPSAQPVWKESLGEKLRRVAPAIPESEWKIKR